MQASDTDGPGARTVITIMWLIALTIIVACTQRESATRDTASAGGTVRGDANASTESGFGDEDVSNVRLTKDKVNRFYNAWRDATIAAGNRVESDTAGDDEAGDLDDIVAEIEREPKVASAIRNAGLSVSEFVILQLTITAAMLANETLKMNPNTDVDSLAREIDVPAANIHFIRENGAEMEAKWKAAKAAVEAAGVSVE